MDMVYIVTRRPAYIAGVLLTFGVLVGQILIDEKLIPGDIDVDVLLIFQLISGLVFAYVILRLIGVRRKFLLAFIIGIISILVSNHMIFNDVSYKDDEAKYIYQSNGKVRGEVLFVEKKDTGFSIILELPSKKSVKRAKISSKSIKIDDNTIYGEQCDNKNIYSLIGYEVIIPNEIAIPDPASNPRCFDNRRYLFGKGINFSDYTPLLRVYSKERPLYLSVVRSLLCLRENFLEEVFTSPNAKAFAKGILFGDSGDLNENDYMAFRDMGSAHILAVSGLHIGILYLAYRRLLVFIKQSLLRLLLSITFLTLLVLYGTMTLWSPSVTRAVLMVAIKLYSDLRKARYDMVSALSIINMGILLIRPYQVYSTGYQMSFIATFVIAVIVPRFKGKLGDAIILPVVIQLFMLPYTMRLFNVVSPLSVLSNVVVVYLTSLYVPIGALGFIIYAMLGNSFLLTVIGRTLTGVGDLIISVERFLYDDGAWSYPVISPKLGWASVYMLLASIMLSETILVAFERRRFDFVGRLLCVVLMAALFFTYSDLTPFDKCSEIYIDVGQGDSLHLNWGKEDMLIDGGGNRDYNLGEKVLMPYLLKNGNNNLDMALTTHEHMDHYKGIQELQEVFPIDRVITSGESGDRIVFEEDRYIDIIWPIPKYRGSEDENYYSRVYRVFDRGIVTLVTGDITEEGEKALIREYGDSDALKCDILKIPHHGSKYSSSDAFLEATSPRVAVISVGNNNYGHPSPEVIEKLHRLGIIVFRTDVDGAIGIIPDKNGFRVCTMKTKKYLEFQ